MKRNLLSQFITSFGAPKDWDLAFRALHQDLKQIRLTTGEESTRERIDLAVQTSFEIRKEVGNTDLHDVFPLQVAKTLIGYGADETTVISSILHFALFPYNPECLSLIGRRFGTEVREAVLHASQIREVHYLTQPEISGIESDLPEQTERERLAKYVGLLAQIVIDFDDMDSKAWLKEGCRGLGIRAGKWITEASQLAPKLAQRFKETGKKELADEEVVQLRANLHINIPLLEEISTLALYAGDKILSRQFRRMASDLYAYCAPLDDRLWEAAKERVEEYQLRFIKASGRVSDIPADVKGRNALIDTILEKDIFGALNLPPDICANGTIEPRPPKDPSSVRRKFIQKAMKGQSAHEVNTGDIIGCRLIVQHPRRDVYRTLEEIRNDPYLSMEEKSDKLASAKNEEYKILLSIVEEIRKKFPIEEDRLKDFFQEAAHENLRDEPNGFRAIHIGILYNGVPIELQLVGYAAHYDNTVGLWSHLIYKGGAPCVCIYGPENKIYDLERGATAADFLASLGPVYAFGADNIDIKRKGIFGEIEDPASLMTQLQPGDQVRFTINPTLANDQAHRRDVINSCRLRDRYESLLEANRDFSSDPESIRAPESSGLTP